MTVERGKAERRALVIGASGGIGSAVLQDLRGRGFDVVGLSRQSHGLDLTDPTSVDTVLGALNGRFDVILIAVGTLAAGGDPEKTLKAIDAHQMARVLAVNTIGPALILRWLDRLLPRSGRCVVAALSARVGSIGDNRLGGWHSYRASKAALNQIIRGAAIESARKRPEAIVVALHPGTVGTEFTKDYPAHKKVSAAQAAANLCDVMLGLDVSQSGGFFDYAGEVVAW